MDFEVSYVYGPLMESWGAPRSKTITWHDPMATANAGAELSGLDFLLAVRDGVYPIAPIGALMDYRIVTATEGEVVFAGPPDESVYNPIGTVHGGYVCTVLDTVTACAVHSTLPKGMAYTSLDLSVSYLRAVTRDSGLLTARGWVTRPGRRAAFAHGEVRDGAGKLVATATSTCLVFAR